MAPSSDCTLPQCHCVIRRPCYLQIRSTSTPPSPSRPRRRRHGRTPTCPNRKRPARPSETRRRHCSRSDRTSRGKRWPLGRRHAAPFCSTRSTASRREKPVDAPMHAPAVLHAITRTHALHVNADRQSQRDRACALLVLVCLRLGVFVSGFRLSVRFLFAFRKQVIMQDAKTYDADATKPMRTRCARSRIKVRCCHRDHGQPG